MRYVTKNGIIKECSEELNTKVKMIKRFKCTQVNLDSSYMPTYKLYYNILKKRLKCLRKTLINVVDEDNCII